MFSNLLEMWSFRFGLFNVKSLSKKKVGQAKQAQCLGWILTRFFDSRPETWGNCLIFCTESEYGQIKMPLHSRYYSFGLTFFLNGPIKVIPWTFMQNFCILINFETKLPLYHRFNIFTQYLSIIGLIWLNRNTFFILKYLTNVWLFAIQNLLKNINLFTFSTPLLTKPNVLIRRDIKKFYVDKLTFERMLTNPITIF